MSTTMQPTTTVMPLLLDAHGVARLYSISDRSVWRLYKQGELPPPVQFGQRTTRWRLQDLLEHIRELEAKCR